jgi:hypothetical protein
MVLLKEIRAAGITQTGRIVRIVIRPAEGDEYVIQVDIPAGRAHFATNHPFSGTTVDVYFD